MGKERYFFNRGELDIINSQLERGADLGELRNVVNWCCQLTMMVDKLYGEVATLKHELGQLKDRVLAQDDGCLRCPHGVPLESYEGCRQCDDADARSEELISKSGDKLKEEN